MPDNPVSEMSPEDKAKAFDKFMQGRTLRSKLREERQSSDEAEEWPDTEEEMAEWDRGD